MVIPDENSGIGMETSMAVPGSFVAISKKKLLHNLDINTGGRINTLLDSMKASSPTHVKAPSLTDDLNRSTLRHDMFDEIASSSEGKQIAMFLDYDGTLSPIVDDPERAFMPEAMRATVRKLARYFPTAIVSGRCRDKVYSFVRLAELYYAGSHGMDIKGPSKGYKKRTQAALFQPASEFLPMINEQWIELAKQVGSVLEGYPNLQVTQGRKVLEIRPTINWDKGKALEFLLESLGYTNCVNVFPIYIGDDRTDKDAFKVLREKGQGFEILVSKAAKDTSALYSLQEPSEVMAFLRRLVGWKRTSLRRENVSTKLSKYFV